MSARISKWAFLFEVEIKCAILAAGLRLRELDVHVYPICEQLAPCRDYSWSIEIPLPGQEYTTTLRGMARQKGPLDYRDLITRIQRQFKSRRIPWHNRLRMWWYVTFARFP